MRTPILPEAVIQWITLSIMVFKRSNLRRLILKKGATYLAIVLVLGSGLQQVRAFCLWSGATAASGLATATANEAHPAVKSKCCCHSYHASKAKPACGLETTSNQTQIPSHPCNNTDCQHCWCCQAPLPRIVTTDTNSLLKFSDFFAAHSAASPLALPEASTSTAGAFSCGGMRSLSALQRCTQLCRFLA